MNVLRVNPAACYSPTIFSACHFVKRFFSACVHFVFVAENKFSSQYLFSGRTMHRCWLSENIMFYLDGRYIEFPYQNGCRGFVYSQVRIHWPQFAYVLAWQFHNSGASGSWWPNLNMPSRLETSGSIVCVYYPAFLDRAVFFYVHFVDLTELV